MVTAAVAVGGCAHLPFGQGAHEPPVRPASMEAQEDINLLLHPSAAWSARR
jgi:hypothetical protein